MSIFQNFPLSRIKIIVPALVLVAVLVPSLFVFQGKNLLVGTASAAAPVCTSEAIPSSAGTASQTLTVNNTGTYRIWSRLKTQSPTNNSYYLQIDNGCPVVVGDSDQLPQGAWNWINYQNGNTESAIDVELAAGAHTFKYIKREAKVQLDRVLALSNLNCVPQGLGDNCTIIDTTAPVVSLTSPEPGATVRDTINLQASVYDVSQITKVEFYVDGQLQSTQQPSSEYGYTWDTRLVENGDHTLQVKAYDDADPSNVGSSSVVTVKVKNPPAVGQLDTESSLLVNHATIVTGETVTATVVYKNNSEFPVKVDDIKLSARVPGATEGSRGYFATADKGPFTVQPGQTITLNGTRTIEADDPRGTYWAYAEYIDTAGDVHVDAIETSFVVLALDATAPVVAVTSPAANVEVLEGEIQTLTADASDDTAVTKVEIYVDGDRKATLDSAPYSYEWDTDDVNLGEHTITAKAYDAAGNSETSTARTITILPQPDVTHPEVNIAAPAGGSSLVEGSDVSISAEASDNVGVTQVEFFIDGVPLSITQSKPYEFTWNTVAAGIGPHTITVKAADAAGNTSEATVLINIVEPPDTTKPVVSLTAPDNDSTVISGGNLTVSAEATDNKGVAKVEFYLDGTVQSTITDAPYEFIWSSTGVAEGNHEITAKAYDAAGNTDESADVHIKVLPPPDTTKPAISFIAPVNGATVEQGSSLAIKASATDNIGVTQVEFFIDGVPVSITASEPYEHGWNTIGASLGAHTLRVVAADAAGNSESAEFTIQLITPPDTTPPTIAVSSPAAGATVQTDSDITVRLTANDNQAVERVELSIDGVLTAYLTDAPYVFIWNTTGLSAGTHSLTAKAFDTAGNVSTSTSRTVTVTVKPGTGLSGTYYRDAALTYSMLTRVDSTIDFNWGSGAPASGLPSDKFSIRWTGQIMAPATGTYKLYTTADDGIRVWVNGTQVINDWGSTGSTTKSVNVSLVGGQKTNIKIEHYDSKSSAAAKLEWSGPSLSRQVIAQKYLYPLSQAEYGAGARSAKTQDVIFAATATTTKSKNSVTREHLPRYWRLHHIRY